MEYINNNSCKQYKNEKMDDAFDLRWIQATLQGNQRAFENIVNKYTPIIFSLAYRMLNQREEAEDAVQEIFIKIYKKLGKYNIQRRFYTWIYTLTINLLRSKLRKQVKSKIANSAGINELHKRIEYDMDNSEPINILIKKETESMVQIFLEGLDKKYKEVFLLRHFEGLSIKEISEILEIPEGTVKVRLFRAKNNLIKFLTAREFDNETIK